MKNKILTTVLLGTLVSSSLYSYELDTTKIYTGYGKYSNSQNDKSGNIVLTKPIEDKVATLGVTQYIKIDKLPKNYLSYIDYSYNTNSDKKMHNLFVGVDRYSNSKYNLYIGSGIGYSLLDWSKDPLNNSTAKDENSGSIAGEIHAGILYALNNKTKLDISLKYLRYDHDTDLKVGTTLSTLEDTSQYLFIIGIRF